MKKLVGEPETLPEKYDQVECPHPDCSREMYYRDMFEHFFATHIFPEYPYQLGEKTEETTNHTHDSQDFSVSDYVDDYELKRDQEEDDKGIEIQEATGGKNVELQKKRIRKKWETYIERLRAEDEIVIQHREKPLGPKGPKGWDAALKFTSDLKRLDTGFDARVVKSSGKHARIIKVKK